MKRGQAGHACCGGFDVCGMPQSLLTFDRIAGETLFDFELSIAPGFLQLSIDAVPASPFPREFRRQLPTASCSIVCLDL